MITPDMNRIQIFNPETKTITKRVPLFPKIKINRNVNNIDYIFYRYNVLFLSDFNMEPDKPKFSFSMHFFNRVDIFFQLYAGA